jgi:hypothetical protein
MGVAKKETRRRITVTSSLNGIFLDQLENRVVVVVVVVGGGGGYYARPNAF